MSILLLDRTRKINKLIQTSGTARVEFVDIAELLSNILTSNVLVFSKKGKLLAIHEIQSLHAIKELLAKEVGKCIDSALNDRILNILSTKENINFETLGFSENVIQLNLSGLIIPVEFAGQRLGSVFIYREDTGYNIDDIILGEYGATVIGLEIMRGINEENKERERKIRDVHAAFNTLSFSENKAIRHILIDFNQSQGIIVASKVAQQVGITRSVIVNALRKFESAGLIETRSLGMKGTYIKVLNDLLVSEME